MAQNVTIAGASYTDVTAIEVPKTTSGVASFHDVTDTTATAEDVAEGKYFYTAAGVKTEGTATIGEPSTIDEIIARTISGTYSNSTASSIGTYAFTRCEALEAVSFPMCTTIASSAFQSCYSLNSISFPMCETIMEYGFQECSDLTSLYFPRCVSIGSYAFNKCTQLVNLSFPECVTIGAQCFPGAGNSVVGSLTSIYFPKCTTIKEYAFMYQNNLKSAIFPECVSIGANAFVCSSSTYGNGKRGTLINISFPKCTYIGQYAFYGQASLSSVSFPSCSQIGSAAFEYCTNLTTISFPNVISIYNSAFLRCDNLIEANFPLCTNISGSAFNACSNLASISFPECIKVSIHAFVGCSTLCTVYMPKVQYISSNAFTLCSKISTLSFPSIVSIYNSAFTSCISLASLYLLGSSVVTLGGTAAFSSTPMSLSSYLGHWGSIYVPASLVDAYKSATNWKVYSSRIVGYVEPDPVIIFPPGSEYALNPDDLADWMDAGKTIKFYLGSQDPDYGTPDANIDGYSFVFDYTGLGITSSEVRTGAMYHEYDIIDVPSIGDMTGYVYSELNNGILRVGATMYLA